jgi:hypothetical protein
VKTEQLRKHEANRLLRVIARTGRNFFRHGDDVSYMEIDKRGRVWFVDSYSKRRVYTHYSGEWKGFTNGGTLRSLVIRLRDYIKRGTPVPALVFGPWPEWYCGGDLWGYGDDMGAVRSEAARLGISDAIPPEGE